MSTHVMIRGLPAHGIFISPDHMQWARWLAVDEDHEIYIFRRRPFLYLYEDEPELGQWCCDVSMIGDAIIYPRAKHLGRLDVPASLKFDWRKTLTRIRK